VCPWPPPLDEPLAHSLDAASSHVLAPSLTTVGPFGLIAHLAALCGLRPARFKGTTAGALIAHLRGLPKRTVVLLDESHLLPDDSLEDLRLLTADDLDRRSPFALVLVGQPLLKERLAEPQHYALAQRLGVRLRLRPLNEAELPLFVERHLKAAGSRPPPGLATRGMAASQIRPSNAQPCRRTAVGSPAPWISE
jgi:general secretion pathway protein A